MMPDHPILIIGAGPVGLSLARALTLAGIPVQVFEGLPELSREARASTFHPPTLELFDAWGLIAPVLAQGHRVDRLQYWERETRTRVADFDYKQIADVTPYPFRLQLPQCEVTRLLKPLVETHPCGEVLMNHHLVNFSQEADCVRAEFESPDGIKAYRGSWLCGADGSRSTVRKQLGLTFDGSTYPDRFLLLPCEIDLSPVFPNLGPVNYIFDPREWVIILHLPDVIRIVFQIPPGEEDAEVLLDESIHRRLHGLVGDTPYTLRNRAIYSVHQRVAEAFRVGRVLLLGDAAHINNPAGGMGMNSGIHDAAFLARQFVKLFHEGAGEAVLDEYAETRRRWAVEKIQAHTDETYKTMIVQDEPARAARNAKFKNLASNPVLAREYLLRAAMLEDRS